MCNDNLILDDLVFSVSDEHWVNVDEIPDPQSGKLIRGSIGTFSLQDYIESSNAPKLFMQLLVDIAEMEGMPPDMVKDLRDRFDLHKGIKVKQNDN